MKLGWTDTIILEEYPHIDYAVLFRPHAVSRFVAAWMPVIDRDKLEISWSQGHYFDDLRDCMKYIEGLLTEKFAEAIDLIKEYYVDEYCDSHFDIDDETRIPLAYTEYEDGYTVQVYADIVHNTLITFYNGEPKVEKYTHKEFIETLKYMSFDELVARP